MNAATPFHVSPINRVLDRLDGVKKNGTGFTARCPAHEDRENSLSLNTGDDGRALVKCFRGCDFERIVTALGLSPGDLFSLREPATTTNGSNRTVVRTTRYELRGATGQPAAVHVRRDYADGSKALHWEQPDGRRGLAGVRSSALPLYGIEDIGDANTIVVAEGEKARDALAGLNVAAVGTVTGASGTPDDDVLQPLLGRRVVLWPDHDAPGEQHMERIAARLRALGQDSALVRWLRWEAAPPGGDAADWIAGDDTADELRRLIGEAHQWKPQVGSEASGLGVLRFWTAREIAEATSERPEFVAEPYVVAYAITELDGKAKAAGKTTLTLELCKAVLDGTPFLGGVTTRTPIVYLTEQSAASFRASLRRANLLHRDDLHVLTWHETRGATWAVVVAAAVAKAREVAAKLLVVDTLPQFAGMKGDSENNAGEALAALQPLQTAAAEGLAVVILRHERKSGGDVGDSGRGSSAFAGAVDIVLSLRRAEGASRPTIRHLHALSRFDETPDLLVVEWTEHGYVSLGTETAVAEAEAREKVLAAAPTDEADAVREDDLIAAADVKRTSGRDAIAHHLEGGRLCRVGDGKRGDPYRYWRTGDAETVSGTPMTEEASERKTESLDTIARVTDETPVKRQKSITGTPQGQIFLLTEPRS